MLQMTYPDGENLYYAYDNGGLLSAAWGEKRGNRYNYINSLTYDEFGQRRHIAYGNGVQSSYSYDDKTRRLDSLVTTTPDLREVQNMSYGYDLVGNVMKIQNSINVPTSTALPAGPVVQEFSYDDLYQLTGAQGEYQFGPGKGNRYQNEFTYDTIGNFTRKYQQHKIIQPLAAEHLPKETNYLLNYQYTGPHPHAVTDTGDKLYSYDAGGNMTGWDGKTSGKRRTILWNEENRVKEIQDNGKSTYFLYDDQGERVLKRSQHGETFYINRFYSIRNGELGTKSIYAGNTRIVSKLVKTPNTTSANTQTATNSTTTGINGLNNGQGKKLGIIRRLNGGTSNTTSAIAPPEEKDQFFYHGDHLGSSNMITDSKGAVYQHLEYFPYGETWIEEGGSYGGNTPGYKFTGKELDPETGLYYFGARYYEPVISRWISPDPALGKFLPGLQKSKLPAGGVFTSANINLFNYGSNDPIKFVDPDGWWGEEVHLVKSESWAKDAGFNPEQAKAIAKADNDVDSISGGKSFLPVIGNQGYHFNTNKAGGDSRKTHADNHLSKAISAQKTANSLRNADGGLWGWVKNKIADFYEGKALKELGTGLHPLQDIDAHDDQVTEKSMGVYYHNSPELNKRPNLADNPSIRPERIKNTESQTKEYLKKFSEGVNANE